MIYFIIFFKEGFVLFCFLTGVIGADVRGYGLACEGQPVTSRLAVICGTSSCHMGVSLLGRGRGDHRQVGGERGVGGGGQPKRRCDLLAPLPVSSFPSCCPARLLYVARSPARLPKAVLKFAVSLFRGQILKK